MRNQSRFSFKFSIATALVLFSISCAPIHTPKTNKQVVVEPDRVSLQLATAVDKATAALEKLAATEQKRTPFVQIDPTPRAPAALMRSLSLDWSGSIEQITQHLADQASYNFVIQGDTPPVPVIVNVSAVEKPIIEILRDIGLQAGQRANIVVNAPQQRVEIQYVSQFDG